MHDHLNGGRSPWPTPSPLDIMFRIEGRLGGLEAGQRLTLDAVKEGFRKADHAHARITALKSRVDRLETSTAASGQPLTDTAGSPRGLTGLLTALGEVLPPLGTALLLLVWLTVALTAGLNAETVRALLGLAP
jgi:hypothetical protein